MKPPIPSIETILDFLKGRLSDDAARKIEKLMQEDQGFALEVGEIQRLLEKESNPEVALQRYRTQYRQAKAEFFQPPKSRLNYLLAAASVIGLMLLAFWWFRPTSTADQAKTWLEWEETVRLRGQRTDAGIDSIEIWLREKQYQKIVAFVEPLLKQSGQEAEWYLLLASSLCQLDRPAEAIIWLSEVIGSVESLPAMKLRAHWYRGLAYVMMAQPEKAREDLLRVQKDGGSQIQKQATWLLDRIETYE